MSSAPSASKRSPWFFLALFLAVFLLGMWVMKRWLTPRESKPEEQAVILVEKLQKVAKLVTVEGYFLEHYDYGEPDPGSYFIGPFINWSAFLPRKEAHLRIRARVLIGYDLEQMKMETRSDEKRIYLSNLPEPEVLAIDTEIDKFDNQSSVFRPLEEEDYVAIDKGSRKKIEEAIGKSHLMEAAREQGNDMVELMRFIAEQAGWELVVVDEGTSRDSLAPPEGAVSPEDSGSFWRDGEY